MTTIDLEHADLPVGQLPLGVEVTHPPVAVAPHDLSPRAHQAEPPAESSKIKLAQ
jgi:hypothetical protein